MGLQTYAIVDELDQMKEVPSIGQHSCCSGDYALVVAALEIINTMLMSILERTREIGIMKAIGGSEKIFDSFSLQRLQLLVFWELHSDWYWDGE